MLKLSIFSFICFCALDDQSTLFWCFFVGLCGVVLVSQWLDRDKEQLSPKQVKPYVELAARWMLSAYGALEQDRFITDKEYLATMLKQYQVCIRMYVMVIWMLFCLMLNMPSSKLFFMCVF